MGLQSLDIIRRSATTTPPPSVRGPATGEVAKLIDVSKCIGCKACQAACMEWNDLRDEIGTCSGTLQNPPDLSAQSWTLVRFTEYANPKGDLEWLIRKDGMVVDYTYDFIHGHTADLYSSGCTLQRPMKF